MILVTIGSILPVDLIASVMEQSLLKTQNNEEAINEEENNEEAINEEANNEEVNYDSNEETIQNVEELSSNIDEEVIPNNENLIVDTKENVVFPDAKLAEEIRKLLGIAEGDIITKSKLETLTGKVTLTNKGITNLEGIQYAKNITEIVAGNNAQLGDEIPELCGLDGIASLKKVDFRSTAIKSPKFLSKCNELSEANFYGADLHDVSGLENSQKLISLNLGAQKSKQLKSVSILNNLPKLETFSIMSSGVEDITGLDLSSPNLRKVYIQNNAITDISPFSQFVNQRYLATSTSNNLIYDLSPHKINYTLGANNSLDITSDNSLSDHYDMGTNFVTLS
ncbi:MAG: hypothetical protein ACRC5R_02645, partial [Mycoplasmatales bacterium]